MAAAADFYLKQAESCAQAAAKSSLENQRETLLRSREAWLKLAKREHEVQAGRVLREQDRAEAQHEEITDGR